MANRPSTTRRDIVPYFALLLTFVVRARLLRDGGKPDRCGNGQVCCGSLTACVIARVRRLVIIVPVTLSLTFPISASASGPTAITPEGSANLWNQIAPAEWVWNPPGDPWPLGFAASDPSGVCMMTLAISGSVEVAPSSLPYDYSGPCPPELSWTPSDGATVDTRAFVVGAGPMDLSLAAVNSAHIASSEYETVQVDNDAVGVSLGTINDPSPNVWVNHAVTVDATPHAGPSGIETMHCQVDGIGPRPYPTKGMILDGDGLHTVSCTAWNNAVDPQGVHNIGTGSITVHIDEVAPSIRFEPRTAHDPTEIVADATDGESGVASGSIQLASSGTTDWVTLPTSFDGAHVASQLDDRQRKGSYVLRATSCDNAGNCSSATEAVGFPLRTVPDFEVSLTKIADSVRRRVVYKQVRVDWHWATIHRSGRPIRVKRGGHFETIRVVKLVQHCTTRRVRRSSHRWHVQSICTTPHPHLTTTLRVPYGHGVTVHGLYTTTQGVPLRGQSIAILTAVDNHVDAFREVTTAITSSDGSWTATLPPGPSRLIRAVTDGTTTILPATGQVTAIVPSKIELIDVWPRHVPWGATVHLVGRLFGGYLPPGGALVRLRIGYGSTYNTYGVQEHVAGDGRFSTVATFGPGDPRTSRTYWFQIASLPMGNYPFAPAASQRVPVIVGGHPG